MELADILTEGSVLVCAGVRNKTELLNQIATRAAEITGQDRGEIESALLGREALGSTGLGNGIAVPHGKIAGLQKVAAIFARCIEPVDFDAVDDQPVDLAIALLAPMGSGADHLKALARVARLLRTEWIVERLRATDNPGELYSLLTGGAKNHAAA